MFGISAPNNSVEKGVVYVLCENLEKDLKVIAVEIKNESEELFIKNSIKCEIQKEFILPKEINAAWTKINDSQTI